MLKIYNTLTRKKEIFSPQNKDEVLMYTCGITSYDFCHIGHARSLYFFEVLKRVLEFLGFKVKWVRNITDIDDKIIEKAKLEFKDLDIQIATKLLAEKYIKSYYQDLELLGLDTATIEPKATENIKEMIEFIEGLIKKGHAYCVKGNVYFKVKSFPSYGKLSLQDLDSLLKNVRIEKDENKKDPLDFALWKASKKDEPCWDSPWGKGRPGWHIECSTMSLKFLGETLDIHGGGTDLIFPHHENEIAQSESLTQKKFSLYWVHHGMVLVEGKKMSKSLGNFITIKDFLKTNSPDALKILILNSHYRQPLDFSKRVLDNAENTKLSLQKILYFLLEVADTDRIEIDELRNLEKRFTEFLEDDINTPGALSVLFELQKRILDFIIQNSEDFERKEFLIQAKALFKKMLGVLGLFKKFSIDKEEVNFIKEKIAQRALLRKKKEFKKADIIREELKNKGIILEDLPKRTLWYRKELS